MKKIDSYYDVFFLSKENKTCTYLLIDYNLNKLILINIKYLFLDYFFR